MCEEFEKTMNLPFSNARKVGNLIFVSGQIPKDNKTGAWGKTIEEQTRTCLEKIKCLVEQNGATVADIAKTTVFLTNMDYFAGMSAEYVKFFNENGVEKNLPARSVVEIGHMIYPEWFLELDCIAVIPS